VADQPDPAKLAAKLAQHHRWALLWLPADGAARSEAPYQLAPAQLTAPGAPLQGLFDHVVRVSLSDGTETEVEAWRLTPLGREVRALVAAHFPKEASLFAGEDICGLPVEHQQAAE
jgi:hypothetical protein